MTDEKLYCLLGYRGGNRAPAAQDLTARTRTDAELQVANYRGDLMWTVAELAVVKAMRAVPGFAPVVPPIDVSMPVALPVVVYQTLVVPPPPELPLLIAVVEPEPESEPEPEPEPAVVLVFPIDAFEPLAIA